MRGIQLQNDGDICPLSVALGCCVAMSTAAMQAMLMATPQPSSTLRDKAVEM